MERLMPNPSQQETETEQLARIEEVAPQSDVESGRHVAVVNETLVKKLLGNEDPIGKSIKFSLLDIADPLLKNTYFEIIGTVVDLKNVGLEGTQPEAFLPYTVTGAFERGIL